MNTKPVYEYNGLILTTDGELCTFSRNFNLAEIQANKTRLAAQVAGHDNVWDLSNLNGINTRAHGIEAVEAGLADFVVRRNLDT